MQLRRFSVSGLSIILSALAANAFSNSGKEIASSDARRSESSKIVEVANNEKSKQFRIEPKTWTFKGHDIAYEKSQSIPLDLMDSPQDLSSIEELEEPILLLNGFGVGSFHQHRLKENLAQEMSTLNNSVRNIYGIDYLGQGKSWPSNCDDGCSESERGLAYNIDLWSMQVIMFIEEVVIAENSKNEKCKVHLVGNSVGGHLATIIVNERPDLIRSISLLNATPVWGLGLPGWDAKLPAPFIPKAIGRFLFDRIRDYDTIKLYLAQAYSRPEAFDDELLQQIRSCTEVSSIKY